MKHTFATRQFMLDTFACWTLAGESTVVLTHVDAVVRRAPSAVDAQIRRSPSVNDAAIRRGPSLTDTVVRR